MQDAFAYVLFATVAVGGIAALIGLIGTGRLYERIGKDGLYRDEADAARPRPHHGGEQVDVETELRALTAAAADPELEAEVRAFVVSRNERRLARGQEPLDVDAEVARRLRER